MKLLNRRIDNEGLMKNCSICHKISATGEDHIDCMQKRKVELGDEYFKQSAKNILSHIYRNFDERQGYWYPFDSGSIRSDLRARLIRPVLRWTTDRLQLKGRIVARMADHILPLVV